MNILFLGGDNRMLTAYEILSRKHNLSSIGLFENDNGDIKNADVILLPVPATRDNKTVFAPLTDRKIPLDIVNSSKRGTLILTCGYDFFRYPQKDYSKDDSFCVKNAVATAEGAIAFAVNHTPFTLCGSKILVIGFGRVGKALVSRLSGFAADITVSARSKKDIAFIDTLGLKSIQTKNAAKAAKDFDVIFNTVDIPVFENENQLENTCLFDLSSKGCLSFEAQAGGNFFKLPGIPGKTASVSAGRIIAETVEELILSL